jgi:hypothetical protein
VRRRALLHVSGLPGAGKTTFIESLVAANDDDAFLVVRAWHDAKLRAPKVTSDVRDVERAPDLARYLRAGAMTAVGYAFGAVDVDDFFTTGFMDEYSTVVVTEGDDPTRLADLNVHVLAPDAPPVLVHRERPVAPSPGTELLSFFAAAGVSEQDLRKLGSVARRLDAGETVTFGRTPSDAPRPAPRPAPRRAARPPASPMWAIADAHAGLAEAQVVVVTMRSEEDRAVAQERLAEIARLRGDPEVFQDLRLRLVGGRVAITAVAADLTDRRDPGTRKALARARRAIRSTTS